MKLRRGVVLAGSVLMSLAMLGPVPAHGLDRGQIYMSNTSPPFEQSYPGISGVRPNVCDSPAGCGAVPFAQVQYPGCQAWNGAYCDAIKLTLSHPPDYQDDLFFVNITVSWERGATNNKLDSYVFTMADPALGPALVRNNNDEQPKTMRMFAPTGYDPGDPEADPPEPPKDFVDYYMTIVNERGVNSGYTLHVEWFELEIDLPDFRAPDRFGGSSTFTATSVTTGRTASFDPADGIPTSYPDSVEQRTVLVPGDDGELQEITVPVIARGDRAPPPRRLFDPVVAFVVGFLMLSGAVLAFLAVRKRQTEL